MTHSKQVAFAALLAVVPLLSGCRLFDIFPREFREEVPEKNYDAELLPGECALEPVTDPSQYPDFGLGFGEKESLIRAIDGTIAWFQKPSSKKKRQCDEDPDLGLRSLQAFKQIVLSATSAQELNQRIVQDFDVFRSKGFDRQGNVFFTAYCQPIYPASETQTAEFRFPLYMRPQELKSDPDTGDPLGWGDGSGVASFPSRRDFDTGLLSGRDLELYWVKERLQAYIIHVQGSAKLVLPSGEERSIGYAGKTGRPYVGLGRSLVEDKKIKRSQLSLTTVKKYFAEHPDQIDDYIYRNESYVFFTDIVGGPFGSMNIEVTPYRTLATDKTAFPRGGITFVQTEVTDAALNPHAFNQFMIDQDTGGAIRSAGRADIFMGTGPDAERAAGGTASEGRLWYIFLKRGASAPGA